MRVNFPFAALVGQQALQDALVWLAIDPAIGGALVTGTRGTAKSTAVRAIVDLLPPIDLDGATKPTPFVELPIGATEDRVIGTLDVRALLSGAERRFEPGLLARAHCGVLYVDEINLLPDHLVDVLLDAAATGVNVIERDGVSFEHDARIMLVGTMNPEEGELRPQLLDRFGLCVAIANDDDVERRVEIVERRIAFDRDPHAFVRTYDAESAALRALIARARAAVGEVVVERERYRQAATLALEARAEGMRADLTIVRTARAIAALEGRAAVSAADVERAAGPALAHRRRATPRGTPPSAPPPRNGPASNGEAARDAAKPNGAEKSTDAAQATSTFDVGAPAELELEPDVFARADRRGEQPFTSRGRSTAQTPTGIAFAVARKSGPVAALATIRAAARERTSGDPAAPLDVAPRHLRFIERRGRRRQLVVFLVDASGSMAAAARMRAAKGVVCALLEDAHYRRDAVALVAFRGEAAEVIVPPTRSVALAYRRLQSLPTGGRTPLAAGLQRARELIGAHARREPSTRAHLVIVSDARANVPQPNALEQALQEAQLLRGAQVRALCIDTEHGRIRLRDAVPLAGALGATYRHLDECNERALGAAVREWMATA